MRTSWIDQDQLLAEGWKGNEMQSNRHDVSTCQIPRGCVEKSSEGKESEGMNGYYLIVSSFGFTRSDSSSKLLII